MRYLWFSCVICLLCSGVVAAQSDDVVATSTEIDVSEAETAASDVIRVTTDDAVLEYVDEVLVASEHDLSESEKGTIRIEYAADGVVVRELHDVDADGTYDLEISLDAVGNVVTVTGSASAEYTLGEVSPPFVPLPPDIPAAATKDLVGDISDVTIVEPTNDWIYFVLLFLVGVLFYLFWQSQR